MDKLYRAYAALAAVLLFLTATSAIAALNCVGCHGSLTRGTVVHDPVAAGNCFGCHIQATGEEHPKVKKAFRFQEQGAKLCQMCHENKSAKAFIHKPVAEGRCLACHNPHSSDSREFGPIPQTDFIGTAIFRYWPFSQMGTLLHPTYNIK